MEAVKLTLTSGKARAPRRHTRKRLERGRRWGRAVPVVDDEVLDVNQAGTSNALDVAATDGCLDLVVRHRRMSVYAV